MDFVPASKCLTAAHKQKRNGSALKGWFLEIVPLQLKQMRFPTCYQGYESDLNLNLLIYNADFGDAACLFSGRDVL